MGGGGMGFTRSRAVLIWLVTRVQIQVLNSKASANGSSLPFLATCLPRICCCLWFLQLGTADMMTISQKKKLNSANERVQNHRLQQGSLSPPGDADQTWHSKEKWVGRRGPKRPTPYGVFLAFRDLLLLCLGSGQGGVRRRMF